MPFLRAVAANAVFYLGTLLCMLVFLPLLLGPRSLLKRAAARWAYIQMWLIRWSAGIQWEIRWLENLPRQPGGNSHKSDPLHGMILAVKHQSAWETFGLLPYLPGATYIMKKELARIPIFGWYLSRVGNIAVDRGQGAKALRDMARRAKAAVDGGRQIIIFPEGTRQDVDAAPDYKPGVVHLYKQLGVPLVPVALNSGLFWPRRRFARYPGTIIVSILPAIPPGLPARELRERMERAIEDETALLIAEGRAALSTR